MKVKVSYEVEFGIRWVEVFDNGRVIAHVDEPGSRCPSPPPYEWMAGPTHSAAEQAKMWAEAVWLDLPNGTHSHWSREDNKQVSEKYLRVGIGGRRPNQRELDAYFAATQRSNLDKGNSRRDGEWHKLEALGRAFRVFPMSGTVWAAPLNANGSISFKTQYMLPWDLTSSDDAEHIRAFLDGEEN